MFENIKAKLARSRYEHMLQDSDCRIQGAEQSKKTLLNAITLRWGSQDIAKGLQDDSIDIEELLRTTAPEFEISDRKALQEVYPLVWWIKNDLQPLGVNNIRKYVFDQILRPFKSKLEKMAPEAVEGIDRSEVSDPVMDEVDKELDLLSNLFGDFTDLAQDLRFSRKQALKTATPDSFIQEPPAR